MAALLALLVASLLALCAASGALRGRPAAARKLQQKEAWWMPPKPADLSCLMYYPAGCFTIRNKDTCLWSKDGRDKVAWNGLKIYAEPCVWCGGKRCTNNNTNLCEPYDFLYHGEGVGFHSFANTLDFEVSKCSGTRPVPISVPKVKPVGCSAYTACASQGLQGSCCPTADNMMLACCASPLTESALTALPAADDKAVAVGATLAAAPALGAPVAPSPAELPSAVPPSHENDTWWQTPQPTSQAATDCLMDHWFGCPVIISREVCLGSRDGRLNKTYHGLKIRGQPCVWCGGVPCTSGSLALCQPLDYAMNGQGVAFHTFYPKATYQVAICVNGHPLPAQTIFRHPPLPPLPTLPTLAPWWAPDRPTEAQLTCLVEEPTGCSAIKDMGTCLSSRDGRPQAEYKGLKIHGEPCVWCAGISCTSNSSSRCEPFDYVMHGEGSAFGLFLAKSSFAIANCDGNRTFASLPDDYDTSCLEAVSDGCGSARDAQSCLSMRDDRDKETVVGLKLKGQPCAWCGGFHCTSENSNLCEPYDFIANGLGRAFSHKDYHGYTYRVAGCKNGRPAAISVLPTESGGLASSYPDVTMGLYPKLGAPAALVPFWVAVKPSNKSMQCLQPAPGGCRSLTTMESCMTGRDASGVKSWKGLKIDGEPCVWCGGGHCTSNSSSLCDPFDFAMYGEGAAYKTFIAKGIYKVADCQKPHVQLPQYSYSCLHKTGPGGCSSIWDAQTCLRSKDGSRVERVGMLEVHGQPCVWCGGTACHSGKNALCEAFDFALNGESTAFMTFFASDTFRLAACKSGKPTPATLKGFDSFVPGWSALPRIPMFNHSWYKTPAPTGNELTCLMDHWYGCDKVGHEDTCLGSKDAQPQALFGPGIQIEGSPCAWCGGGPCISGSTALCQPFSLLMQGEGTNFTTFFAKNHYQVARCKNGKPLPPMPTKTSPQIVYVPVSGSLASPPQGPTLERPLVLPPVGGATADVAVPPAGDDIGSSPDLVPLSAEPPGLPPLAPLPGAAPVPAYPVADAAHPVATVAPVAMAAPVTPGAMAALATTAAPSQPLGASEDSDRGISALTLPPVATIAPLNLGTIIPEVVAGLKGSNDIAPSGTSDVFPPGTTTAVPGAPVARSTLAVPGVPVATLAPVTVEPPSTTTAAPGVPVATLAPVTAEVGPPRAAAAVPGAPVATLAPVGPPGATTAAPGAPVATLAPVTVEPTRATTPDRGVFVAEPPSATTAVHGVSVATLAPPTAVTLAPVVLPDLPTVSLPGLPMLAPVATVAPVALPTVAPAVPPGGGEESAPSSPGTSGSSGTAAPSTGTGSAANAPAPADEGHPGGWTQAATTPAPADEGAPSEGTEAPTASKLGPPTMPPLQTIPSPNAAPGSAPADCWVSCGGTAGSCAFCGQGMACCRQNFASDPPECQGASGFSVSDYHQCVRDGSNPSASLDVGTVPPPSGISFRKGTDGTDASGTAVIHEQSGGSSNSLWIWVIVGILLLSLLLVGAYLMCSHGKDHKGKTRRRKSKRAAEADNAAEDTDSDSFSSTASSEMEMEMTQPLVQAGGSMATPGQMTVNPVRPFQQ